MDSADEFSDHEAPAARLALLRCGFGALLLVDGVLELQPGAYQSFISLVSSNAAAAKPVALRGVLLFGAHLLGHQPVLANGLLGGTEVLLGAFILLGICAGPSLVAAVPLSLGIWLFGEGLGLPLSVGSTDVGAGLLYAVVACLLWLSGSQRHFTLSGWAGAVGQGGRLRGNQVAATAAALIVVVGAVTGESISAESGAPGFGSPSAVGGAVLAYDPRLHEDLLWGGCGLVTCSSQSWTWDGRGWTSARSQIGPGSLGYSTGAYAYSRRGLVLFGGAGLQGTAPPSDATWLWSGYWQQLPSGSHPAARRFASIGYDPLTHQTILIGGDNASAVPFSGTWLLSAHGWVRLHPSNQPPARAAASMAWDPKNGTLLLFGGEGRTGRSDSTWEWNGGDWVQLHPRRSPPPLAYEAMATDPSTQTVLLFAGAGAPHATWLWTGSTWTPVGRGAVPPVYSFESLAPTAGGRVLLFGGATASRSGFSSATWLWDGIGWKEVGSRA